MKISNRLHLTYIPNRYWREPLSKFHVINKVKSIPENSSFFMLWIPENQSEDELNSQIKNVLQSVPADKLLTCEINLAFPHNKQFFKIDSVVGKIMPIPPAVKLLFELDGSISNTCCTTKNTFDE